MTTYRTAAAALLIAALAAQGARAEEPHARRMQVYTATCAHFHDRLAAARTGERVPLLERLSRNCDLALARLAEGEPDRAAAYLDRLSAYKATLVTMTLDRMFDPDAPARAVSATGEYLIARRMGVISTMSAMGTDADFPVADGE